MSANFFIHLPQKQEFVSIGKIAGWGVSGYPQNEYVGALALHVLFRDRQGGIRIVSHEDYQYDNALSLSKDITKEYAGLLDKSKPIFPVNDAAIMAKQSLITEDGLVLPLAEKENASLDDVDSLKRIAQFVMSHGGKLIKLN